MRTSEISGFFDVRVYKANTEPKDRKMKAETETITFNATFAPDRLPQELSQFAKPYTSSRDGSQRFAVKFKIGGRVKWVNGNGQLIDKIPNAELDGKKWRCIIDYSTLNGNPAEREASGYWVNAIMLEQMADNPFEGMAFAPVQQSYPAPSVSDTDRIDEIAHQLNNELGTFEAHMEQESKIKGGAR